MKTLQPSEISYIIEAKIKGIIPLSPTDKNFIYKNNYGCYCPSCSYNRTFGGSNRLPESIEKLIMTKIR